MEMRRQSLNARPHPNFLIIDCYAKSVWLLFSGQLEGNISTRTGFLNQLRPVYPREIPNPVQQHRMPVLSAVTGTDLVLAIQQVMPSLNCKLVKLLESSVITLIDKYSLCIRRGRMSEFLPDVNLNTDIKCPS